MHSATSSNPRSILHALQPLGQGGSQAESLASYLCRLATSHSASNVELSRKMLGYLGYEINPKYAWYQRQISGHNDGAMAYAAALIATTTVTSLNLHTFLPWKNVISGNGLPLHPGGQFCAQCLHEDQTHGRTPYMRLCWEPAVVSVCHIHHTALAQCCPHCGNSNIRHSGAFSVVGWCGQCRHFLGTETETEAQEIDELALWQAQQIATLVELQQGTLEEPDKDAVLDGIAHVIEQACDGQYAALARHLGIAKSTVHSWIKERRTPSTDMSLRIARFAGVDLASLLLGRTDEWSLRCDLEQMILPLAYPTRPKWERRVHTHDWVQIEQQLQQILKQPMPVSVLHAASVVRISARALYMHCNETTRKIGKRWLEYLKRRQQQHIVEAWPYLESACRQLLDEGTSPNQREMEMLVPAQILNKICNFWDVLQEVRAHIESSELATACLCAHEYQQKLVQD